MTSRAPDANAQGPVWKVHAPISDLVSRDAPQRHDEHVRQGCEVQQLSCVNRACVLRLWKGLDPSRFVVGLFCEFVGPIRVLQSSFRMPVSGLVIALFIVFGSSAVGLGSKLVVLSSLAVQVVHRTSVQRKGFDRSRKTPGGRPNRRGIGSRRQDTGSASYTQLGMNTEHFKKRLRDKERELQSNLAGLEGEARASGEAEVRDSIDDATSSQGTSESFEEGTLVSQTFEQVRDALHRLEDGNYGRCTLCGCQIERMRLEAVPWTPYCLEDQQKQDRQIHHDSTL
jgi:DnaK suppressor protein